MSGTLNLAGFTTQWDADFTTAAAYDKTLVGHTWGQASQAQFGNGALTLTSGAANGWQDVGFMQDVPTSAAAGEGYGLYQMTASTNKGEGGGVCIVMWPGNNQWPGAEIDLLESVDPNRAENFSNLHWKGSDGSNQYNWYKQTFDSSVPHTYAIDWEPGRLTYYIDGQQIWTTTDHVPLDAAHGGVNEDFGAEVTNAGSQAVSSSTSLHIYDMSYSTMNPAPVASPVVAAPSPAPVVAPIVVAPVVVAPAPLPLPVAVNTTIGSGSSSLAVQISEDAYQGDAQYTISVDGKQVGGVLTAHASHALGQDDVVTVKGDFLAGNHTVAVNFLNDLYGGTAGADRNLHVDGISLNGAAVAGGQADLGANGARLFGFAVVGGTPVSTTIGSGAHSLVLKVSEDAYQGDAQYTVSVDGQQIGGVQTAHAAHSIGQDDTLTVKGDFASGSHVVTVNFLNDLYGGNSSADRNLYVDAVSIDGAAAPGGQGKLESTGSQGFGFTMASAAVNSTIGTGASSLVLKVSEDAYQGDAQYTVTVDGKQIGGVMTAHGSHALGQDDLVTVKGDWAAGSHAVAVNFLNDAYGGSSGMDRNLHIDGISLNGSTVSGGQADMGSNGIRSFGFNVAATPVNSTIGSGANSLMLKISEDAFQGDAQYTVKVDGKQVGGIQTAHASHWSGQDDLLTVQGNWGSGSHKLSVTFLNDLNDGHGGDRNLYVDGGSYNGHSVSAVHAAIFSPTQVDMLFQ